MNAHLSNTSLRPSVTQSRAFPSNRSSNFRTDIEGLRGIAILVVVLFHCGVPIFNGGFVGVDVFFVLSGYLITGILVAEAKKPSGVSVLQFYARRVRRLLPASCFSLLITLLVGAVFLSPNELLVAGRAARASSLYASNIFFALNAQDYFAADVRTNPFLHTWSLAVEEQFYLFWPLLVMMGLQLFRSKKLLLLLLSAVAVLSFVASIWFTTHSKAFAFYGLPTRAWEFTIGGVGTLPSRGTLKPPPVFWVVLGSIGMLAILG